MEGSKPPGAAPRSPEAEEAAAAPEVGPGAPAPGRIRGAVTFLGAIPPQTMYVAEAGEIAAHAPIVDGATRGLKDAVVWLEVAPGLVAPPALPRDSSQTVDQSSFTFVPHVLAVRSGDPVRFTNSDNANHNIHCLDTRQAFNSASTPGLDVVRRFHAHRARQPLELRCDVHAWMRAWIYVFEHPWFAVTDARGRFELKEVPPGEHTLWVHHADGALATKLSVSVTAAATSELTLTLGSAGPTGNAGSRKSAASTEK